MSLVNTAPALSVEEETNRETEQHETGATVKKGKSGKCVNFAETTTILPDAIPHHNEVESQSPPFDYNARPETSTDPENEEVMDRNLQNGVRKEDDGLDDPPDDAERPKETEETAVENVKPDRLHDVHAKTVVTGVIVMIMLFWLLMGWMFGVGRWETAISSVIALAATMGYVKLYSENVKMKKRQTEFLNVTPGVVGLRTLMKDLPTWLSYTKTEKVEWLNKALSQMWPFYDKAVCDAIKESVEPVIQSVKPPIFKDIRFSRLKFGDVPFRVEGVEIVDRTESEIVLDIDIRWSGDAYVALAIEPNIPSMTDVTRMAPKVTDISCYGTLRLIFKPLVSEMPGFGAVIATFTKTPTVRFNIDFGKALGGNVSGKMVKTALDSFIRDTIINLYVWPQRLVIPVIYDETITGPIEDLELRHVGLLAVKVVEARELPAADMNGTSDPTIELWTRPERKYNTAVVKKTLNPVWEDEVHHLLIQEPRSQNISVTASDVDFLNVSDVFKSFNIIKNLKESVYAKEFLGRALIPVRPAADTPGEEVDDWYDLGENSFGHPDGPGSGCGSLHLKMIYTPFTMLDPLNSAAGAVTVTIIRCRDLMAMDRGGTSDPYVKIKLGDKVVKTHVVNATCDPEFHVNFEFFDVPVTETLRFSVFDKDFATRDDPLGSMDLSVQHLARSTTDSIPGSLRQWFKLTGVEHGEIQLKLQYIPMDTVKKFST